MSLLWSLYGACMKTHKRTPLVITRGLVQEVKDGGVAIYCSSNVLPRKTRVEANKKVIMLWFKVYSAVG